MFISIETLLRRLYIVILLVSKEGASQEWNYVDFNDLNDSGLKCLNNIILGVNCKQLGNVWKLMVCPNFWKLDLPLRWIFTSLHPLGMKKSTFRKFREWKVHILCIYYLVDYIHSPTNRSTRVETKRLRVFGICRGLCIYIYKTYLENDIATVTTVEGVIHLAYDNPSATFPLYIPPETWGSFLQRGNINTIIAIIITVSWNTMIIVMIVAEVKKLAKASMDCRALISSHG